MEPQLNKAPVDANSRSVCVGAAFYAVFSDTLAVTSEALALSEHIHCFTKRFECSEIGRGGKLLRLALFRARRNRVMFCCPELGYHTLSPEGTPAWIVYRRVFAEVALGMGRANYALHASCVADGDGRALLVSGVSDSGKTSTLLALLQRGFRYAGDDYSIIGLDDGRLRALPVVVTVNEATFGLSKKCLTWKGSCDIIPFLLLQTEGTPGPRRRCGDPWKETSRGLTCARDCGKIHFRQVKRVIRKRAWVSRTPRQVARRAVFCCPGCPTGKIETVVAGISGPGAL